MAEQIFELVEVSKLNGDFKRNYDRLRSCTCIRSKSGGGLGVAPSLKRYFLSSKCTLCSKGSR